MLKSLLIFLKTKCKAYCIFLNLKLHLQNKFKLFFALCFWDKIDKVILKYQFQGARCLAVLIIFL